MAAGRAETLPTTLLTGFLGSGKTTLLNGLLAHPGMADTAVIVNEFGEVGLDHLLIETAFEDAVLLRSGCICCTVRGDLVDTLLSLRERVGRGEIPPFHRVAIETTGLADPAPILQTLMTDPTLLPHFRLDRVIATIDAVHGLGQLDQHYEAVKQAALADRLVLTKTDLVTPAAAARLTARLAALNPGAPIVAGMRGALDPAVLFGGAQRGAEKDAAARAAAGLGHDHAPGESEAEHLSRHHGIASLSLTRAAPVAWPALSAFLAALAGFKGADLLRIKGIVNVAGRAGPVVIQGVQHLFHPPLALKTWPDQDRRSRLVFITRNLPAERLAAAFEAALAEYPAAETAAAKT